MTEYLFKKEFEDPGSDEASGASKLMLAVGYNEPYQHEILRHCQWKEEKLKLSIEIGGDGVLSSSLSPKVNFVAADQPSNLCRELLPVLDLCTAQQKLNLGATKISKINCRT
jgi:hypothetical protein